MKKIALAITAAAMLAVMAPIVAQATDDCNGQIGGFSVTPPAGPVVNVPKLSDSIVRQVGPFYLDVRYLAGRQTSGSATGVNIFSIWLYQETNGTAGLQRGGHSIFPDTPGTSGQDPCEQSSNPDQAIF
jgi:hypothetical protein